jgi:hypothetical protein
VPIAGAKDVLEKSLPYGAQLFRVMADEGGPRVAGPGLTFEQGLGAQGSKLLVWTARDLAPGTRLNLEVSGLPPRPLWAPLTDSVPAPFLVAALLALVPALGVFWTLRDRARPLPQPSDQPTSDGPVELLADLDDAFAGGRVSEPEYRKRRRQLKSQLRTELRSGRALPVAEEAPRG